MTQAQGTVENASPPAVPDAPTPVVTTPMTTPPALSVVSDLPSDVQTLVREQGHQVVLGLGVNLVVVGVAKERLTSKRRAEAVLLAFDQRQGRMLVDGVDLGLGHLVPAHVTARQADEQHWDASVSTLALDAMKHFCYRVSHMTDYTGAVEGQKCVERFSFTFKTKKPIIKLIVRSGQIERLRKNSGK